MRSILFTLAIILSAAVRAQIPPSFQVIPNPAHSRARIELHQIDIEKVEVTIFTVLGTQVNGIYQQIQRGDNKINLYFPDLPEGIYLIRIRCGEFDRTQRLKVQRQ